MAGRSASVSLALIAAGTAAYHGTLFVP